MSGVKIVLGVSGISCAPFETAQSLATLIEMFEVEGVDTVDTSQNYGQGEKVLGEAKAGSRFNIDTKHAGGVKPGASRTDLVQWPRDLTKRLQLEKLCTPVLPQVGRANMICLKRCTSSTYMLLVIALIMLQRITWGIS